MLQGAESGDFESLTDQGNELRSLRLTVQGSQFREAYFEGLRVCVFQVEPWDTAAVYGYNNPALFKHPSGFCEDMWVDALVGWTGVGDFLLKDPGAGDDMATEDVL